MRRAKRVLISALLLFAVVTVAVYFLLPATVLHPPRGASPDVFAEPVPAGVTLEPMRVTPEAGVTLEGFRMAPEKGGGSRPTVVLLHGICSSKDVYGNFARYLCDEGFRVVAFDSRGHGRSRGGCCTYGWYEKKDISLIIDEIHKGDPGSRIGVFGNSMGGAIALQAMAEDPRIECGVIESTFASLPEAACLRAASFTGVRIDAIVHPTLRRAGVQGSWRPFDVLPEEAAKSIHQPVMLSHGTADEVFPIAHGRRIYGNLSSPAKEWIQVENGRHSGLGRTLGPDYERRQIAFLKKWLTE
ncbi:alpha/beta fold hydrolase [Luteolibacter sp. SL250]|uniref:alpha/beta hydrolase n=1 Tax=Luteolibacter sp. SL250 TaxID=2995170 RepID=UPI0022712325|nr:alpha/beta fold hydrolase [Luteolibacter sp. SL250]WAC19619.1 alpha/beta fold hydrolase [Luteolibacter sp. SL250]